MILVLKHVGDAFVINSASKMFCYKPPFCIAFWSAARQTSLLYSNSKTNFNNTCHIMTGSHFMSTKTKHLPKLHREQQIVDAADHVLTSVGAQGFIYPISWKLHNQK
jgi:hypothetical protein